jgi:hypothetical protein
MAARVNFLPMAVSSWKCGQHPLRNNAPEATLSGSLGIENTMLAIQKVAS